MIRSGEIVCQEVTKHFPENSRPAVDHVSFKVAAGDLVVLLGPSGCGKTTLLKMINRLYEPDQGQIWIGKEDIQTLPVNQLRRQIGYAIQQVGLFPHMTIWRNIAIVPRLLGWDEEKINMRCNLLLELVGLSPTYLGRYPRQLSGGEQQRVGLARALAADPQILLMDEPFAAVDAINRERLQSELLIIHRKLHKTILFVTHDVEEAFRLADKIIILKDGQLIQYGTPVEIVVKPENEFVAELVGSNNLLRKLSLFDVQSLLEAKQYERHNSFSKASFTSIQPQENLRTALSMLLESGAEQLHVVDNKGKSHGVITFQDLHRLLFEQFTSPAAELE
ncbi:MAG: ABC transporter ATP-binding protein [Chloroflexi bacterium 44-23]|nr:MAG: ABC transporter ATP-binding protein [Chloroflexi bacterium 44-23]